MSFTQSQTKAACAVVLSPPGNPAAFLETREFIGREIELHDWRFKERQSTDVHQLVREYRRELSEEIAPRFDAEAVGAVFVACTGMSYGHSPTSDRDYWEELERSSGMPIATATRAVEELWRAEGYDSMILVSPYDDLATAQAEQYWAEAGLPVRQVLRVQGGHPYVVTTDDLERALRDARFKSGIPILLSGTGMRTSGSLPWIESLHDAPVWSVNLAGASWLTKNLG